MLLQFNKTDFIICKSSQKNWDIISAAQKDFYWVRAADVPSAHVIIETDQPLEEEIKYACQLCKEQSKKVKNKYIITQVRNLRYGEEVRSVTYKDSSKVQIIISQN